MILIPLEQLQTSRESERLVRHSSYAEEKHWSLQALTEEMNCNLI